MSYDFFATFQIESKEDVDNLTRGSGKYAEISDVLSRVLLLVSALSDENLRDYVKVGERGKSSGLKSLIHSNKDYNDHLLCKLSKLNLLGINSSINASALPKGSWILEFFITLAKPFISQDDIPFYIIDNPVRKDKVFGIPLTSAMAWKGNLRWTMMKIFLEPKANQPEEYAKIRFQHTLLFGTEKGMEEKPKGWSDYLDGLCPNAKEPYRNKLEMFFRKKKAEDVHLQGMLYFYPTFWDKIDMGVINPQDRRTKTGTKPIYFEVVPAGARALFRVVYVPLHHIGLGKKEFKNKIFEDLKDVVEGIKEMMLTYGFSAKKSIGYGVIEDRWNKNTSRLEIKEYMSVQKFSSFDELENVIKKG